MNTNEKKLQEITRLRELAEKELKILKDNLNNIHGEFESKIKELQDLKDMESAMLSKFLKEQKEQIKNIVNLNGLKDRLQETKELFSGVKKRGVEMFNATTNKIDTKWLDERYNKYKNDCISLGEEITSRENFKNAVDRIGKRIEEFKNVDFHNYFKQENNQVMKEVSPKRVLTSKKEGLIAWLETEPEDKTFSCYIKYLVENFENYEDLNFIYIDSPNSFYRELKKNSSI